MPAVVDTNVLGRLATGDSAREHAAAERLVLGSQVIVVPTVLLETEWVLRSRYGYSVAQFLAFAAWLAESPTVTVEASEMVQRALELHRGGLDFADAMHLAAAHPHTFATFDRALLRRARRLGLAVEDPKAVAGSGATT